MGSPQITLIALWALSIGMELSRHGQKKTGEHDVFSSIIAAVITASILWWGGFWG